MTIDLAQIKDNSMVRYGFKILLMRELISISKRMIITGS